MPKTSFSSVDAYIASKPAGIQPTLTRVRNIIRKALPKAEEVISYQIPAYKLNGRAVIYFAAWKEHFSIYPAIGRLAAKFKDELAPYKLNIGTIRFPLSQPVPATLISRIAKFRAKEVLAKK